MSDPNPPRNIAVLLFPGFQLLDLAGPLDVLNLLAHTHTLHLSILAATLAPVSTHHRLHAAQGSTFAQSIVPTHTFADAPLDTFEVLIVPGGFGTRDAENIRPVVECVRRCLEGGRVRWCLSVCTGSVIVAGSGGLEGRRATSNKRAFEWVKSQNDKVIWVPKARWVVDGIFWTSSGISAGIDLIYAWVSEVFGEETASYIADSSEYERSEHMDSDRFAERWGVV